MPPVPAPPNIIFVLTDDQRMDAWRYMDTFRTRMIHEGVYFNHAEHPCSLCMPSRAILQTGMLPQNTGVIDASHISPITNAPNALGECTWEWSLARMLHEARGAACPQGYNTGFVGKYCNANWFSNMPNQNPVDGRLTVAPGWDHFVMSGTGADDPHPTNYDFFENGQKYHCNDTEPTNKTQPTLTTNQLIDYRNLTIKPTSGILGARDPAKNPDDRFDTDYKQDVWRIKSAAILDQFITDRVGNAKPFFMQISLNCPHIGSNQAWRYTGNNSPKSLQILNATFLPQSRNFHNLGTGACDDQITASTAGGSPSNDQASKLRGQSWMVQTADDTLNMIFAKLDAAGITDDTVVVYFGDNGLISGDNWVIGGKQERFDSSTLAGVCIRGPQFGRGASPKYAQGQSSQLMMTTDLVPTLVDLVNTYGAGVVPRVANNNGRTMDVFDGQSLLDPALDPNRAIPFFDTEGGPNNKGFIGIVTKDFKYIETNEGGPTNSGQFQLFKYGNDLDATYASIPSETINSVSLPAFTYTLEQELTNLVNPNTGVLLNPDPKTGVASTYGTILADLKTQMAALQTCRGASCRVTVP